MKNRDGEVSNINISRNKNNDNFELLCCAVADGASHAQNTVDLIDEVASSYESPKDIIIEQIIMKPIVTPTTETMTVATRATKPNGDEDEQNEVDDDEEKVDEVQPEEVDEQPEVDDKDSETQDGIVDKDKNVEFQDAIDDPR
jgi:hypothetical protein